MISIDEDLGVDYQDAGPWRSYQIIGQGKSIAEFLKDVLIYEIDQNGGELNYYDIDNADREVENAAVKLIIEMFNIDKADIVDPDPTPWCSACGATFKSGCSCEP
jgi:hypothetical protein